MYIRPCAGVMTQEAQLKLPSQGLGAIRPNQAVQRVYARRVSLGAYLLRGRPLTGELGFVGPYPGPVPRRPRRLRGLGQAPTQSLPYIPAGSQLVYHVDFSVPTFSNPLATPASIAAQVSKALVGSGILVIGNNASGSAFAERAGFDLTLQLEQDYNTPQMVQSVVDGKVNATGFSVVSSSISVANVAGVPAGSTVALPGGNTAPALPGEPGYLGPPGSAPPAQQTFTDWIGSNWYWFAIGGLGLLLAREVL